MSTFNTFLNDIRQKNIRISGGQHKWINSYFIKLCTDRDNLFKLAKLKCSPRLLCAAKQLRNKCNTYIQNS